MSQTEITPELFTTDYIGQPGERTFYLQSRGGLGTRSWLVEKQQVAVLAEKLQEMLFLIDQDDTIKGMSAARDPALRLQTPVEADFRVGIIGLAYEEEADLVIVFMQPAEEEASTEDEAIEQALTEALTESEDGPGTRLLLRRDQVRSFVLHATAIVAEGRPLCQLCGLPIDPEGHVCPATNGHRRA